MQINKAEKKEQIKNKIQSTIQFVTAQEELQKIKNQIAIEKLKFNSDNKRLEALEGFEFSLLKQTLIFTAKADGEKITPELLKDIQKWAEENHNDGNGNSGDSNAGGNSGDSNAGDNSGKGSSNSGQGGSNSGKGKGK